MHNFRWSEENEVFLPPIDAEHRDLFRLAGALQQALGAGAPSQEIEAYWKELVDHSEEHFQHEEWLMQSSAYPSYGWHRNQHDTARRRMKLFAPMIAAGDQEAVELFFEFLTGWLEDHTSVTDRMMAAHIRNYDRAHPPKVSRKAAEATGGARKEEGPHPSTVRFCKSCGAQTTHEITPDGMVCRKCAERSVSAELDRD